VKFEQIVNQDGLTNIVLVVISNLYFCIFSSEVSASQEEKNLEEVASKVKEPKETSTKDVVKLPKDGKKKKNPSAAKGPTTGNPKGTLAKLAETGARSNQNRF